MVGSSQGTLELWWTGVESGLAGREEVGLASTLLLDVSRSCTMLPCSLWSVSAWEALWASISLMAEEQVASASWMIQPQVVLVSLTATEQAVLASRITQEQLVLASRVNKEHVVWASIGEVLVGIPSREASATSAFT